MADNLIIHYRYILQHEQVHYEVLESIDIVLCIIVIVIIHIITINALIPSTVGAHLEDRHPCLYQPITFDGGSDAAFLCIRAEVLKN